MDVNAFQLLVNLTLCAIIAAFAWLAINGIEDLRMPDIWYANWDAWGGIKSWRAAKLTAQIGIGLFAFSLGVLTLTSNY